MEITERVENPITSSKAMSNENNQVEVKNDQPQKSPEDPEEFIGTTSQGKHLKYKIGLYF